MLGIYLALIDDDDNKNLFEELYYEYRNGMYNIAFGILHNVEDAEDAVHEAFLCIANKFEKYHS
ncbi:MAG: RNA polymerase sigma factor [Porcipelethomonas sp.]